MDHQKAKNSRYVLNSTTRYIRLITLSNGYSSDPINAYALHRHAFDAGLDNALDSVNALRHGNVKGRSIADILQNAIATPGRRILWINTELLVLCHVSGTSV